MPMTKLLFYQKANGRCPVVEWLEELHKMDTDAYVKCAAAIELLAASGHELSRPTAAPLRDGIYELRPNRAAGNANRRILYFFNGKGVAVLAHPLTKDKKVPPEDIDRAIRFMNEFKANPKLHTYRRVTP